MIGAEGGLAGLPVATCLKCLSTLLGTTFVKAAESR